MIRNRLLRILVLVAIGLALGGGFAFVEIMAAGKGGTDRPGIGGSMAGVPIGGPFTLIDHTGKTVTEKDFPGHKLVYFGFTYCPAICPTELQKIAQVMEELGPRGDSLQPLFITVDPERDTPQIMQKYVEMFHPRLVGLTGSPAQIEAAVKAYRVYAAKAQDDALSDYTMDHSSFTYLISHDNKLLAIYKIQDKAEDIAQDIARRLESGS